MTKNLYYQHMLQRKNIIKDFILTLFLGFASVARMPIEVLTRKNFGERYFSFTATILMAVALALFPLGYENFHSHIFGDTSIVEMVFKYLTWYPFLALFVKMAIDRRNEIRRLPSVFDFERYSLSTGILDRRLMNFKIKGKAVDIRTVETLIEPGVFLAAGIVLVLFKQTLGYLLIPCSLAYSLSYVATYNIGDQFIMDLIDKQICNEELADTFVNDTPPSETRGFQSYGRRPSDPDLRRKVANSFFEDDEPMFAQ
jgi:hypothetical protein